MGWKVIVEPLAPAPAIVVGSCRKKEAAERHAQALAAKYRFKGEQRPKVYVQRDDSADQLQSYAHGTKAHRDQPDLPAYGQDVVILAPTARSAALAPGIGT